MAASFIIAKQTGAPFTDDTVQGYRLADMLKGYRYTGRAVRISDATSIQDLPIYRLRTGIDSRDLCIVFLEDERPRPFVDFDRPYGVFLSDTLRGSLSTGIKVSPEAAALFPLIRQELDSLRTVLLAKTAKLPINGAPMLTPALAAAGYFIKGMRYGIASVMVTVWHRNPSRENDPGARCCSLSYDLTDDSLHYSRKLDGSTRGRILVTTQRLRAIAEDTHPASSFFSDAGLQKIKGVLLSKNLAL